MKIVGCDLHARQQTIAMVDTKTGEFTEKTISHEGNAVREFYAALAGPVVVGIEATGSMQWFLELLEELGIECRVGHPAKIRAKETRKQKHDRRDAGLMLDLLIENRFPEIWMPSTAERDLRTLLRDRHQWVRMRTRLQHTLQAIALNHALRKGHALWSAAGQTALEALSLPTYTGQRRTELLSLYMQLQQRIQELDKEVEAQAQQRPQARRLLTHPGVGPVTALATEVFLGDPSRFTTGNQVASYIGMIPCEHTSGKRQRLGKLTKQGNSLLRYLWTEATMHAVGKDPELKRFYRRKLIQKGMGKARIAAARKLGIRLWIMLRDQIDYEEFCRRGKLRQSGEAQAGMPDFNSGPALQ
ncbi:MAG: IS110 family transposase [Acidobacteriia bacterium]|jgi:transposase|nr:IS110 family transposase [Terriglobia bacterium]